MDRQAWGEALLERIASGEPIVIFGRAYHLDHDAGECRWCQDNLQNGRTCPRGPFDKHPLRGTGFQSVFGIHAESMDWRHGQCPAEAPCWGEGEIQEASRKVREMFYAQKVSELRVLLAEAEKKLEELQY